MGGIPDGEGRWTASPIEGLLPRFETDAATPAWKRALELGAHQRRN